MSFSQLEFILLLLVCVLGLRLLQKSNIAQKALLLVASLYFFAWLDVRFLPLLLGYVAVGYAAMQGLAKTTNHTIRFLICASSVALFLLALGIFKYANFFLGTLHSLFGLPLGNLIWILPLGISFYTFQCISLVVDVYLGKEKPCGFLDFSLLVCFFPKLTAGPLVRFADIRKQLDEARPFSVEEFYYGSRQFIIGLFQKTLLADRLSPFVDEVFANHSVFNGLTLWLAVLCYTVQIYCDFSGYSNMAIGCARMLGFHLPENFDWPYLSQNITEFWRRWHITLSFWLRDYLYIPLGGNRKGKLRSYLNQFLTMVLGGLWHGANWTFVVWGTWHGLMLVVHKLWLRGKKPAEAQGLPRIAGTLLTFLCVMFGWIFFRAETFDQAFFVIRGMFLWQTGILWFNPFLVGTAVLVLVWHIPKFLSVKKFFELPYNSIYSYTILFTMVWMVIVFHPTEFTPFVYGNF
jgi:alginate O-acetyltransferase complex protein AlgI